MRTRLRTFVSSLLFAGALSSLVAAAMTFGTSTIARAQSGGQTCGVGTLQGRYIFTATGINVVGGVAVPKAILEGIDFNGDGTLAAPFATVSINGTIIRNSGVPGTYTVAEDCTGTVTFGETNFDTFAQHNGKQLWMIQTTGPGGTPAVFEGTATKVTR